jgi:hypothetical protein
LDANPISGVVASSENSRSAVKAVARLRDKS